MLYSFNLFIVGKRAANKETVSTGSENTVKAKQAATSSSLLSEFCFRKLATNWEVLFFGSKERRFSFSTVNLVSEGFQVLSSTPKEEHREMIAKLKEEQKRKLAILAGQYESTIENLLRNLTVKLESWQVILDKFLIRYTITCKKLYCYFCLFR